MFSAGLRSVDWVSKITLTKSIEDEVRTCFDYTTTILILETFRRDSIDDVNEQNTDDSCNMFGENKKSPRLGFGRQVKQL